MASSSAQQYGWIHDGFVNSWTRHNDGKLAAKIQKKWLRHRFLNAISFNSRAKPSIFLLLREWLQICDKDHTGCHRRPEMDDFWPRRVIYVGDRRQLTLVEEQHRGDDYLVLSHCWGLPEDETKAEEEKNRVCTTPKNYKDRLHGFGYDELPKTFQDAIQVTRALGKNYLWIDALCIIQGPGGDWNSEAGTMASIFAYAYCTIAASSAPGWADGFLSAQPDSLVQGTLSAPTCACDFDKDVEGGNLMKRAWVLQERVLSRRIIHFTSTHIYSECGNGVLCEKLTNLTPPLGKQRFFLDPNFPSRLNEAGYLRTVDFVQFLFRKYSTSGLTFAADRDVAIYSLVKRMGEVLETEVRYGIFHCFLGSLLLWKRDENKTSPISYGDRSVPSWSWMAYPGGIDFILAANQDLEVPRDVDLGFIEDGKALNVKVRKFLGSMWFDVVGYIRLEDCNCVVVGMVRDKKKEGALQTYHVLIIREKVGGGGYKRVGVGKMEARYISRDYVAGTLW
ncbi:heterokaryon incompatibility protein-domain-containing protein [Immersiella caudata]|uniref:Heterokaryon incompatibility protein-domain-containing protein n=1 Tax=Immersiella caudata TaxID=314043 RepID=A0AA40C5Q6_9PEZI|nr:heterokaryon incompatibility protein-domain-containing protein [Immersiella caudata]